MELADDAELAWAYRIRVAAEPDEVHEGEQRFTSFLRHWPAGDRQWSWREDHGLAVLRVDDGTGNGAMRLYVDPDHRRRGIGRALLAVLVDQARTAGCRTVRANFTDEPAAAFSASVGAVEGEASVRNLLTLPHRDTAEPVPGYALRSWLNRTPDDLLEDMARAWYAINDAPTTEGIEPDVYTPERVRDIEESVRLRGVQSRWTVALDADDRIVGFTE